MTPTIPRHAYQFFQGESEETPAKIDKALEAIERLPTTDAAKEENE